MKSIIFNTIFRHSHHRVFLHFSNFSMTTDFRGICLVRKNSRPVCVYTNRLDHVSLFHPSCIFFSPARFVWDQSHENHRTTKQHCKEGVRKLLNTRSSSFVTFAECGVALSRRSTINFDGFPDRRLFIGFLRSFYSRQPFII